jgi:hypothetical protein
MQLRAADRKDAGFRTFAEFYPFYLSEHRHPVSRVLHYAGTWGSVLCLAVCIVTAEPWWLLGSVLSGYSFAWLGHFRFERNRPATFRYPFYSLAGDFRMWWELNLGKLAFRERRDPRTPDIF